MHFSGNFAKLLYICSNDRARTESLLNDVRVCSLADYEKDKIGRIPTDSALLHFLPQIGGLLLISRIQALESLCLMS